MLLSVKILKHLHVGFSVLVLVLREDEILFVSLFLLLPVMGGGVVCLKKFI